jgi:hypothetical protein
VVLAFFIVKKTDENILSRYGKSILNDKSVLSGKSVSNDKSVLKGEKK